LVYDLTEIDTVSSKATRQGIPNRGGGKLSLDLADLNGVWTWPDGFNLLKERPIFVLDVEQEFSVATRNVGSKLFAQHVDVILRLLHHHLD
jgi:hypothetical protein